MASSLSKAVKSFMTDLQRQQQGLAKQEKEHKAAMAAAKKQEEASKKAAAEIDSLKKLLKNAHTPRKVNPTPRMAPERKASDSPKSTPPKKHETARAFIPADDNRNGSAWGKDWPKLPVMGKDLYASETKAKKTLMIASGGRREDPDAARIEFWKQYEPFNAIAKIPKHLTERKRKNA